MVDLDLYKTDVLLKLRTKVIKCAAIWFSDDEDLSEEGRSRNGKVNGIQEILKKRIGWAERHTEDHSKALCLWVTERIVLILIILTLVE